MKVLTLGSGFIADHLPYDKITGRVLPSSDEVNALLKTAAVQFGGKPNVIVNCIGKTGRPNVDWCESHKFETYESNVVIPLLISEWCKKNDVHMVQIGSGCIYFGESPNVKWIQPQNVARAPAIEVDFGWKEDDFANPKSFYSKTKYACDLMLGQMPHVTTLRIRMPISDQDTSRNLINKLRGYKQVIDIPNSVTFMSDLTRCVKWAADNRPGGIYHVANPEPLTAARVMKEFQKYVPDHKFEIINEQQLDQLTVAKRSNCILSTEKLVRAGFRMTNSEYALAICMTEYVKNMQGR
jgi:dTDP-4-dehydrorhamnose reductase